MLRNLLVEAHQYRGLGHLSRNRSPDYFGYELMPPDATGAHISRSTGLGRGQRSTSPAPEAGFSRSHAADVPAHPAGSGLLLDEPDAHLHVILQDAIYGELRSVAAKRGSQLIIATHSEVIIDSVEPRELCMLLDQPRMLAIH